jgi:hypothetical protein
MLGLLRGERGKDGNGEIFFFDLKLTEKGIRKAIEVRQPGE